MVLVYMKTHYFISIFIGSCINDNNIEHSYDELCI